MTNEQLSNSGLPPEAMKFITSVIDAKENGQELPTSTVDELFTGNAFNSIREQLKSEGVASYRNQQGDEQYVLVDQNDDGRVTAVAAAIPRRPGRAEEFLKNVADFTASTTTRADRIALFRTIAKSEGIINNAIQKCSALVATEGTFKVRYVKGQKGKGGDKKAEEFKALLQFWTENLNNRPLDAVVTGARGIEALISQGTRQTLIEGDQISRMQWQKVAVPNLKGKKFSLPINIQSLPGDQIASIDEIEGLGLELFYWVPPRAFVETLKAPKDKNVKPYLDKLISSEVKSALLKDGRYLLDPSLLIHVKNRGTGTETFGESIIESAMTDIAYKRALQALDIVTIENLINRLVIVKVGSDDYQSVYHKQEVTNRRVVRLQELMRRIGPSALIIWAGPDIAVEQVGAHDQVLAMEGRYDQAQSRIREAIGVPSSLLVGEGKDGKAAGISAHVGIAAQLAEIQKQWKWILTTIAERIAEENGYEDVNVVWQFTHSLLADKTENAALFLQGYQGGVVPNEIMVEEMGMSYEAVEAMMAEDVAKGYRNEPFGPPKAAQTTNPAGTGDGGGGNGRPPKKTKPTQPKDPRTDKETKSPEPNK